MFKPTIFAVIAATSIAAGPAYAGGHAPAAIHTMDVSSGQILTDAKGMSLYTFDKDANGVSNCNGGCAAKWPPLMAAADASGKKEYGVITRADGTKQWAYNGAPLYTWVGDSSVGDMTGDGVKGVWHIAKP